MSQSDTVGDFLTRLRNANRAGHEKVDVPSSRLRQEIVRILKEEGYIRNFRPLAAGRRELLRIYFKKAVDGTKALNDLQRVSRPGLRVYVRKDRIPRVLGGLGTAVLSTSRGIMTDREARQKGLGGEHLFNVW